MKKHVALNELLNPFREMIGKEQIIIVLAGIPHNFHELTIYHDATKDSGFISYLTNKVSLGPLTKEECKILIRDNLSNRVQIDEDIINSVIFLSSRRPEDFQIIMETALNTAIGDAEKRSENHIKINENHVKEGFEALIKLRGDLCPEIWGKISERGKKFIITKLNINKNSSIDPLDLEYGNLEMKNLPQNDIEELQNYGFSDSEEARLVVPMYFQEWIKKNDQI
ncbi:MAG: hypothetical protein ACM3SY_11865 [Candidatus Omnitrophota bacterium]